MRFGAAARAEPGHRASTCQHQPSAASWDLSRKNLASKDTLILLQGTPDLAEAPCAPMGSVLGDGGGHEHGVFLPGSSTCFPGAMFHVLYRRFWDFCIAQSSPHPPTSGSWQLQKASAHLKGEIKAQEGIHAGKGDSVAGSHQSL